MSELKLTPWFVGSVPARPGVYQRQYPRGRWYCHWNGCRWGVGAYSVAAAESHVKFTSPHRLLPWRGLAEQPK